MKAMGYIFVTIIVLTYAAVINGWALAKLWSWFIVTTFGVAPVSIPAAIGLAMIVEYVAKPSTKTDPDKAYWEVLLEGFIYQTIKPLIALIIGVIVKQWL